MSQHSDFWDREYRTSEHLALSTVVSEDLEKFIRFLERGWKREFLNPFSRVLDLGCGNGRNLIYLAENFGMPGLGIDVSRVAIEAAENATGDLPINYEVASISDRLPVEDNSANIVLDMMTSHFLKEAERTKLRAEILRVLKPGGWLFFKSFLADEDIHTRRLLRENPADEKGAYIHPVLGVYEYAWTEDAVNEFCGQDFEMHKFHKSHRHLNKNGTAGKRRTFSAYLQKF